MVVIKSLRLSQVGLSVVKHLVRKAEKTVHASRLQFYSDQDLNVTIRLEKQIRHDEWKLSVESFEDIREEGENAMS